MLKEIVMLTKKNMDAICLTCRYEPCGIDICKKHLKASQLKLLEWLRDNNHLEPSAEVEVLWQELDDAVNQNKGRID